MQQQVHHFHSSSVTSCRTGRTKQTTTQSKIPTLKITVNQSKQNGQTSPAKSIPYPVSMSPVSHHIKELINPCFFFFQVPVEVVGGEREENWEGGAGRGRGWQKPRETEQGKGKGMRETREGELEEGAWEVIAGNPPRPRGSLIRGINRIKYKNVDNTKKHDFFATIIVLFCYIYTCACFILLWLFDYICYIWINLWDDSGNYMDFIAQFLIVVNFELYNFQNGFIVLIV